MQMTVDIPDLLFRRAKLVAANRGIPLRQFVIDDIDEKLKSASREKPWMRHLGKLKHLRSERMRVGRRIEHAFEKIDREIWK
jgi:hypothetical protein